MTDRIQALSVRGRGMAIAATAGRVMTDRVQALSVRGRTTSRIGWHRASFVRETAPGRAFGAARRAFKPLRKDGAGTAAIKWQGRKWR